MKRPGRAFLSVVALVGFVLIGALSASVAPAFAVGPQLLAAPTPPCPPGQPPGRPPGQPPPGQPPGRPPTYPPGQCQLLLSSQVVKAGHTLSVQGSGFASGVKVSIRLEPGDVLLARVVTTAQGTFKRTVRIPASTKAGNYQITATGVAAYGGPLRLVASLTVTPRASSGTGPGGSPAPPSGAGGGPAPPGGAGGSSQGPGSSAP